MKKILLLLLIAFPILASAQVITYDTIRVSPDDERNIYRAQRQQQTTQTQQADQNRITQRPILLEREPASGFVLDKSKLLYGVNIGLSFSRNYSSFNLGPQVGYQFSNRFMAGAGIKYYYNKVRAFQYNEEYLYKNNLLGANLFGYFYPMRFLTVFAQPEINHLWLSLTNEDTGEVTKSSGFVPSFLVGGGLRMGRSHITLNYDLAQHTNSPYPRGWFLGFSAFF
ncbi:hypothetical protein SDC9_84866 [bioreactor metagenome]|uniref:Outer membrane protein beta-barrel domain-containing protein n=1 Tax=bioreactor metagenome TaxID=1076179 RepID=A0A644ZC29_9ZZZZ